MFLHYTLARLKQQQQEEVYKCYVTDTLFYQAQGKYVGKRYYDLISKPIIVDKRSAEEIIEDTILKAGLTVLKEKDDDNIENSIT